VNGNEQGESPLRARSDRECRSMRSQEGFTYIGILLAIALIGTQLALAGVVWSFAQNRQKERELLFVGDQFRAAIGRYYVNPQGPQKEYPKRLEDLVRDPRYPGTVRHIRKIYADPITGKVRWGLIKTPDGSILGVYSLSEKAPIKTADFPLGYNSFEKKSRYADWKFVYTVGGAFGRPAGPTLSPNSTNSSQNSSNGTLDTQVNNLEADDKGKLSSTSGSDIFSGAKFGGPQKHIYIGDQ
jgi:type II secretory pathway pseudopilin PulG